ncbi:hypothetical protein E2L08_01955 [Palleronia sediminis]|uniref:DUF4333 domain-containing protein n=1 Tax=Palleronia sediminis TaxID=2547833 RepID=A0A4R6ALV7_9RHOB|nr:hypothetical protein [Palleronia sediminis]TDL84254.1 hypothetical protein E2L08_01955 [Palleronia sediminis]
MSRRLLFAPVAALIVLAAVLGLRWGMGVARLAEGDVVAAMARRYVAAEPAGDPATCVARPGTGRAWVVVTCGAQGARMTWRVDRLGRVIAPRAGGI